MAKKNLNNEQSSIVSRSTSSSKIILAIISIVLAALILEIVMTKTFDLFFSNESVLRQRIAAYVFASAVSIGGQFILLEFVKRKSKEIRTKKQLHLDLVHKLVNAAQYSLVAIMILLLMQILLQSQYNAVLLIFATVISYTSAITIMTLLALRFFSWFKSNKSYLVILYGTSSAAIAIHALLTLVFVSSALANVPAEVRLNIAAHPFFPPGSAADILSNVHVVSSIISFMTMWFSSALLLHHYSHKLGHGKYWIIISMPLVYFLGQFVALLLNIFNPFLASDPFFFGIILTLIFTLSKSAGGILFGLAFWTVARNIRNNAAVRDYLIISAFGLVLLFSSDYAVVLIHSPFPPFGVATISFVGLSSYFVLVGIYSSAISVSQDIELRQSIRKFAKNESRLLDSIGSAQMHQEIQDKIISATKEHQNIMAEELGIHSSLGEHDIKQYLDEVLEETRKASEPSSRKKELNKDV
jgi:hypothetical protein